MYKFNAFPVETHIAKCISLLLAIEELCTAVMKGHKSEPWYAACYVGFYRKGIKLVMIQAYMYHGFIFCRDAVYVANNVPYCGAWYETLMCKIEYSALYLQIKNWMHV